MPIRQAETHKDRKKRKKQQDKLPTVTPMLNLLAYKQLTDDPEHFIQFKSNADGYADLLTIRGQGVLSMTRDGQANLILGFKHFLQAYLDDFEFIISPFPVDTSEQQRFWAQRYIRIQEAIRKEQNPQRLQQLRAQLRYINDKQNTNILVERQLVSEEFLLLLYGKTKMNLRQNRQTAINFGGKALVIEPMSRKKKEETLFRINNLNTRVR